MCMRHGAKVDLTGKQHSLERLLLMHCMSTVAWFISSLEMLVYSNNRLHQHDTTASIERLERIRVSMWKGPMAGFSIAHREKVMIEWFARIYPESNNQDPVAMISAIVGFGHQAESYIIWTFLLPGFWRHLLVDVYIFVAPRFIRSRKETQSYQSSASKKMHQRKLLQGKSKSDLWLESEETRLL